MNQMRSAFSGKKLLGLLLALLMVVSLLPMSVLAVEDGSGEGNTPAAQEVVSDTMGTLTLKGQHSAQINEFKLYTYQDGTKGTTDLLDGKEPTDGAYPAIELEAGDYWAEGYDAQDYYNGGIKITVEAGQEQVIELKRAYQIYATNSGWVEDEDYTIDVKVESSEGTERVIETGTSDSYGTVRKTCLCLYGDTIRATFTPDAEQHPTYLKAVASSTVTSNVSVTTSCKEAVTVTINVPEGSTVSLGTMTKYYIYDFVDPEETTSTSATFRAAKSTTYFYRVQNPDGVTYWNYKSWSADTTETVTEDDLHIGSSDFTKSTVYHNFEKNVLDRADIYLNINEKGYKAMQVGDTFELNVFRNWMAIENFFNAKVALPDMHYQVIDTEGNPSDVLTITPDENNSSVADMKANKAGTAIVLVTYDAMTHVQGYNYNSKLSTDPTCFSAIWPECTGVFIVTVGETEGDIQTNMVMDRMDAVLNADADKAREQLAVDAEHDFLFYTGDEGASYSFTPESGCTVTVDRSQVTDSMTFTGFTSDGVEVASDGTVTISKLTTGRHIVKIEKDGQATYQVLTARQVSYKLVDDQGNELTEEAKSSIKAGDTVYIQYTGLLNPKEKLSGAYNFNFCLHYLGEDGTYFNSNPGSSFGVYDFSGNPERQKIEITIPQYWKGTTYTLTGALKQGGFAGVPTHRGITYASGVNPQYNAPSVSGILSVLPEITLDLQETTFLQPKLIFKDNNGNTVDRTSLTTVTLKDSKGNATTVNDDGTFDAIEDEYTYAIYGTGYEYKEGTITVSKDGDLNFTIELNVTSANAWDGVTKTEPQKEGDIYLISTGAEFAWFVDQSTSTAVSGKLMADIDLGKYSWLSVSTRKIELDGNGKEITGLVAQKGLFTSLGAESYIHDLTIRGTTQEGASVTATLSANAKIENCISYVNVTGNGRNAGGIVGLAYTGAVIRNCANYGDINGSQGVGGIVGYVGGDNITISSCYNVGNIAASSDKGGGIFGYSAVGFTLENCYNTGSVSGENSGGIGGYAKGETHWSTGATLAVATISNCYSTGQATVSAFGSIHADSVAITNCYYLSDNGSDENATGLTAEELKSASILASLGSGFKKDAGKVNNGYPVLSWQVSDGSDEPVSGYTVSATEGSSAAIGETVTASIQVSNEEETTYNSYAFTVSYDAEKLTYTGINTDASVKDENGILTIVGYGVDKTCGTDSIVLTFTGKAVGQANVTVTKANIDKSENANAQDAPEAAILEATTTITVGGYQVSLSDDFTGDSTVDPGADYTFVAKDTHYDYNIVAKMGGEDAEVVNNGDGSYTIKNVTGNLVITDTKTPKTYTVTVEGAGQEDVDAATSATYGTDYSFRLTKDDKYTYDVAVTVGGEAYTPTLSEDGSTYTIAGADVMGTIVITVNKEAKPVTTTEINFTGSGSGDVKGGTTQTADNGVDFTFELNADTGYHYTVTLDSEELTADASGKYTISGSKLTGEKITVTVEKTAKSDVKVEVYEYIKLNSKTMWLVTAAGTVSEGKVLSYDENAMFWSEKYNAYCYLVVSAQTQDELKAEAPSKVAEASADKVSIAYDGDVNKTGLVDVNDAQLTYNMYNAQYESFDVVSMQKFLEADVNGDKTVTTLDSAAIINLMLK